MAGEEFTNSGDTGFAFAARIDNVKEASKGNIVLNGVEVTPNISPDLFVDISAGTVFINNDSVTVAAVDNQAIDAADTTDDRFDIIYVGADGVVDYAAGTPDSNPFPPDLPVDHILLAFIFVENNTIAIDSGDITDSRIINAKGDLASLNETNTRSIGENRVAIIRLEESAGLDPEDYEGSYAEFFSDATGFYNAVDTGNTTAEFSASAYNNFVIPLFDDYTGTNNDPWNAALWIERDAGGTFDIQSNAGQVSATRSGSNIEAVFSVVDGEKITLAVGESVFLEFDMGTLSSGTAGSNKSWMGIGNTGDFGSGANAIAFCNIGDTSNLAGVGTYIQGVRQDTTDPAGKVCKIKIEKNTGTTLLVSVSLDGVPVVTNQSTTDSTTEFYAIAFVDARLSDGTTTYTVDTVNWAKGDELTGSTKIVQTVNLGTTFFEPSGNINKVYVSTPRSADDGGGTITVDISVDGGSNFVTIQNLNEWLTLTANLGTQMILKINLPGATATEINGFAVFFDNL